VARFEPSGIIEFSSAYGYYTETGIAYIPQVSYYFRFVVDPTAHTYSVFVTPAGGAEVLVANNYAFQLQQGGISSIANAAIVATSGSMSVCGFSGAPPAVAQAATPAASATPAPPAASGACQQSTG